MVKVDPYPLTNKCHINNIGIVGAPSMLSTTHASKADCDLHFLHEWPITETWLMLITMHALALRSQVGFVIDRLHNYGSSARLTHF